MITIGLILCITCRGNIFAQNARQVTGTVTDSTHAPVSGVTARLWTPGSTDTLVTISNKKGLFRFYAVSSSHFIVALSSAEFQKTEKEFHFKASLANCQLDDIILYPDIKLLNDVVVGALKIRINGDTIDYKAGYFAVREDAMVEDLLKRLPGIQVDRNGVITAQGKPVAKIKVNGKDFFGSDIRLASRELPAEIIDKVQVIDDYGDLAAVSGIKDGEPEKVINLQLKEDKSQGNFGRASAGLGIPGSYTASASTNFFSDKRQLSAFGKSNNINDGYANRLSTGGGMALPVMPMAADGSGPLSGSSGMPSTGFPAGTDGESIAHSAGINFRTDFGKRNSFFGTYNFNKLRRAGDRKSASQFLYPDGQIDYYRTTAYRNTSQGHQALLNLELYPDSLSYLKISPGIFLSTNQSRNLSTFSSMRNPSFKINEGFLNDFGSMKTPDISIDILYNRQFRKAGRNLAVSLSRSSSRTWMENRLPGSTRVFTSTVDFRDSIQNQRVAQYNENLGYQLNVTYSEPFARNKFLDFSFAHYFAKSYSDRKAFESVPQTGTDSLLYDLSNRFSNTQINNRVNVNYRALKKRDSYSFGLGVLPSAYKNYSDEKNLAPVPRWIINFSPSARFTHSFSRNRSLTLNYYGNSRQPGFTDLQPVRDVSNPLFQREGNPDLKPEFVHRLGLSFNSFSIKSGRSLFATLQFSRIQNKIVNRIILADSNGVQLARPENVNGNYQVTGFYSFSKPFAGNRYVLLLNGSYMISRETLLVDDRNSFGNNYNLLQGIQFRYADNKWLEAEIRTDYNQARLRSFGIGREQYSYSAWRVGTDLRVTLPHRLTIHSDYEHVFNLGSGPVSAMNTRLLNVSLEKKFFKKRPLTISISGYNLLDQKDALNRQFSGNQLLSIRSAQQSRFYLLTVTYRWNKFWGRAK